MQVLNYSEFRKNLKTNLDKVSDENEVVVLSRSKNRDVVMISIHEYNSWKETMHLMSTQNNRDRLENAIKDVNAGESLRTDPLIED